MSSVLVSIVTYQSSSTIVPCLQSVSGQTFTDYRLAVVDNASSDGTVEKVRGLGIEPIQNSSNVGFCSAHNQVISRFPSDYVLVLNPDVQLAPNFLQELVSAMRLRSGTGTACGKLLRLQQGERSGVIDSAGMVLKASQRHFDRGAEEQDSGQYDTPGLVFGASGAAALYRREFIDDVRQGEDFFDSRFFAFREDADLSWRGQWLGWACLYWPRAVAWHERRVTPQRRRKLPPEINYHSVKNRFLMRIKNLDGINYARHLVPITLRDLGILAYILLRERSSLPAVGFVWRHRSEYRTLRRQMKQRRRATSAEIGAWFLQDILPLP